MSTEPTIEERVAALEARREAPTLASLKKKLEQTWQPEGGLLLGESYARLLRAATLADLQVAIGRATAAYVAGATALLTVTHGLGRRPQVVLMSNAFVSGIGYMVATVQDNTWTTTQFSWGGAQMNAAAYNGTATHSWVVIG